MGVEGQVAILAAETRPIVRRVVIALPVHSLAYCQKKVTESRRTDRLDLVVTSESCFVTRGIDSDTFFHAYILNLVLFEELVADYPGGIRDHFIHPPTVADQFTSFHVR